MIIAAAIGALLLYAALHGWLFWRLVVPLVGSRTSRIVVGLLVALLALSSLLGMVLGQLTSPTLATTVLKWVGFIYMGFATLAFGMVVVRDLLWWGYAFAERFRRPADHRPEFAERRRFLLGASSVTILAASGALTARGVRQARKRAEVKEVDIAIAGLHPDLEGFTILQLSDIHVGDTIGRAYVERIVERCRDLSPDLIALTGDLVDGRVEHLAGDVAPLFSLEAPHGTWFVTGNHEYYSGPLQWVEYLQEAGLNVLVDAHKTIEHGGAKLVVAGICDYDASTVVPEHLADPALALQGAPDDADFRLLLAHQPRSYPRALGLGIDLQLSGHTHGGQIWPFGYLVPFQQHFLAGLHRVEDGMQLYISRGTGYWGPPMRVGAPSEITLLRLRRQA